MTIFRVDNNPAHHKHQTSKPPQNPTPTSPTQHALTSSTPTRGNAPTPATAADRSEGPGCGWFHGDSGPTIPFPTRRAPADLLDNAARRRADRQRRLAAQRAEDEARQEQACASAHERRLDDLADEEDATWSRIDALIAARRPAEYDAAVTLLTDLRALAERENRNDTFALRTIALRQAHARKPSLIERLDRAEI